jgi:hypothetical protein
MINFHKHHLSKQEVLRRENLSQEIGRRRAEGGGVTEIAQALGITRSLCLNLMPPPPRPRRRTNAPEDRGVGWRPDPDRRLASNMGICPNCQRLRIMPCASCDPNQ